MTNPPKHEPTPEEIAAECAKIRKGWDEREHHRRAGREVDDNGFMPMTIPVVKRSGDSRGVVGGDG